MEASRLPDWVVVMNDSEDLAENIVSDAANASASADEPTKKVEDAPPSVLAAAAIETGATVVAAAPASSPKVEEKAKDLAPAPKTAGPAVEAKPPVERPYLSLIPFIPAQHADAPPTPPGRGQEIWRAALERRFELGAVAAGLAVMGFLAFASLSYKNSQEQYVVAQNVETQHLAEVVQALKVKIGALETAKRDEIADLRKTVADLKAGVTARDPNSAIAQMNARYDKIEHEQDARIDKLNERVERDASVRSADLTAKLEKLDRVDRDAAAHNADFATRLDKIEKKISAPAVVAAVAPPLPPAAPPKQQTAVSTSATPGVSKETTASIAPQPPHAPQAAPGIAKEAPGAVSKETTGSIAAQAPRGPLRGWVIRDVRGGMAIIEGRDGFHEIGPGDNVPGAGRVERIERRTGGWTVVTNQGYIGGGGGAPGPGYMNGPEGEF
jgi:hypothetical protein